MNFNTFRDFEGPRKTVPEEKGHEKGHVSFPNTYSTSVHYLLSFIFLLVCM